MLFRLIPPAPHPTILYALTFPNVLPLPDLNPSATIPAAWASQLHLLTSILQLEPPQSIHMLDRAVGLVARVHEVSMDVPRKEIIVKFLDGRVMKIAMNSDCVRMLLAVVVDVKGCSEPEDQRNSLEGSSCATSTAGSMEDLPSASSPTKTQKSSKHKRQRSLLFSLISSLVPKSLSSSSSSPFSPPSSAPPPAPLPPLPKAGRMTPPASPQQTTFSPTQVDPNILRRRARATLVDVWRRHVLSALSPQHLPPAGYIEWTLIAMASKTRAEIESIEAAKSHSFDPVYTRTAGKKHRKTRSEGRNALDFGERADDCEGDIEQRRCRAPSPFPGSMDAEDTDRVVYPRRDQSKETAAIQNLHSVDIIADEWGVRCAPPTPDAMFSVEFHGQNESLLGESFTVGADWDEDERLAFEFTDMARHNSLGASGFEDKRLSLDESFHHDNGDEDCNGLANTTFDVSRSPISPSDINDDEESDDSQMSLRTPSEGEEFPLPTPGVLPTQSIATQQSATVSRVTSFRPRSRNTATQPPGRPSTPTRPSHSPTSSTPPPCHHHSNSQDAQVEELIASRYAHLERIGHALDLTRSRAREEGWRLVRATAIGAPNDWMDPDMERALETKAKRRAWSAGIKISAPYDPLSHSSLPSPFVSKVWDGTVPILRSPIRPPGLSTPMAKSAPGPIVPTGLSLGVPSRSSPLRMYAWGADDGQKSTSSKYGALTSPLAMETIARKRSSRVTFADSPTKLFPVCEDESEDSVEPDRVNAVGFPRVNSTGPSNEKSEVTPVGASAEEEDDPFYFSPCRPRTRTTSMYVISSAYSTPSSPILPMFRPRTPPPSYQATVGEDDPAATSNEDGHLDPSALLLQPLSSLSISPPSRPPLTSNPTFVSRPRAISLPTPKSDSGRNKARRISSVHGRDEYCEDLSQAYASPPPDGPIIVSATPAPHEQYPRYAHVHSPIPATGKSMNVTMLGKTGKEVVFEQAGSEFTVGIEVALGRAEEGRVVW